MRTITHTKMRSRINRSLSSMLLLLIVSLAFTTSLLAQTAVDSKAAAVDAAKLENGADGKVIGVKEKSGDNGKIWFEVKILTDGKVRIYKIDKL